MTQPAEPIIRPARFGDLPALVEIYNHYVTDSHVTFDTEPFTPEEREPWFSGFAPTGPYRLLVAELDGAPIGYATSTRLRPKAAYSTSVETTVYVAPDRRGRGYGGKLYRALLRALEDEGLHRAYAGIALPNPASVAMHERLGYRHLGTYREVGRKFGKFWDVAWYERSLSSNS